MKTKLSRWGNSLAIRIPAQIASEAGLEDGRVLSIEYSGGVLRLKPERRDPTLDELVEAMHDENVHEEVDFGDPAGSEKL